VVRLDDTENMTDCVTDAVINEAEDEIQSLPQQSSNYMDTIQLAVQHQQRTKISAAPVERLCDVDCCLLDVTRGTAATPEHLIHRRSKTALTARKLLQRSLKMNLELDVLLTPLSEGQLRRHGLVARNASPLCIDHGGLTPDESHVSRPCALVPPMNGRFEEDVLETIVPLSGHDGCTCTLIPLSQLSHNWTMDDDTEADIFIRSFWDEESESNTDSNASPFVTGAQQDSVNCRGRGRPKKRSTAAAVKQSNKAGKANIARVTNKARRRKHVAKKVASGSVHKMTLRQCKKVVQDGSSKAGKRVVGKVAKTTGNKRQAVKNVLSSSVNINSNKRKQSKLRNSNCRLINKNQGGSKARSTVVLQSDMMKLRPRNKVGHVGLRTKGKPQNSTSMLTHKEKSSCCRIRRQSKRKNNQSKVYSEVGVRKRGRSHAKSTSSSVPSRASGQQNQPCGQTARKQRPSQQSTRVLRKRTASGVCTQPPCKKQKLSGKSTDTRVIASNSYQHVNVHPSRDQTAASTWPRTTRGTYNKKNRLVQQSTKGRVSTKHKTKEKVATSAHRTTVAENTQITEVKTAGNTGPYGKKTRSVGLYTSLFI